MNLTSGFGAGAGIFSPIDVFFVSGPDRDR